MRYCVLSLIAAFIAAALSCRQEQTEEEAAPKPKSEPLLLLDDDPPLLLDDGEGENSEATGPVADNSRCMHCHLNYAREEIALTHKRADIGCAKCHGACDEHIADESWASGGNGTAPDIMYTRDKINPFCMGCHPKEEIAKQENHSVIFNPTAKKEVCTDCHGSHRLDPSERKCKWK